MAQIDFGTAQIIVENAMRANSFGGNLTIGDQVINLETSWTNQNPINYQTLRDAIAKSIVDTLTALAVTGSISQGETTAPNGQIIVPSSSVNVNTINPLKGAARVGDDIAITDPVFLAWIASIGAYASIPAPILVTGKITTGSSTVRLGD